MMRCCLGKWKRGVLLCIAACGLMTAASCGVEGRAAKKVADLEYAVVEEKDIPEELGAMMEERKAADFKMTYESEDALYIVHGYGEQETGGYSIQVKDCYLTENAIYFDTELIGPRKGEQVSKSPSYPSIVVKTEKREESVIFN